MKPSLASILMSAVLGTLALTSSAQADTIVNIKGYSDGAGAGSGVDNPFAAVGATVHLSNPVMLHLAAGDYRITDASGRAGALYDAWDFENGVEGSWTNHFSVGAAQGGEDSSAYTLLLDGLPGTGAGHFGGFYSEKEASDAFLSWAPFTLHLDLDTLVGFAAPDYYLPDNQGGISLDIARVDVSAVPEPQNVMLMMAGLAGLAAVARRRSRKGA